MGLDVHAYSKITYLQPQPEGEEARDTAEEAGARELYSANGYDRLRPQAEGFYSLDGEDLHINCGAYSRYGRWRENLARLAGWPLGEYEQYGRKWPSHVATAWEAEQGPFWELINFGDNEGSIGAEVAKKLLADFEHYHESIAERALLMQDEGQEFMRFYRQWQAGFALAADGGAVYFT